MLDMLLRLLRLHLPIPADFLSYAESHSWMEEIIEMTDEF